MSEDIAKFSPKEKKIEEMTKEELIEEIRERIPKSKANC